MSESERIEKAWDDFLVEADLTGRQTTNSPKGMFGAGWQACAKDRDADPDPQSEMSHEGAMYFAVKPKMRWEYHGTDDYAVRDQLLADGWQPFAVTLSSEGTEWHFRRQVEVEQPKPTITCTTNYGFDSDESADALAGALDPAADEAHCTCCKPLRKEVKRLRREVKALVRGYKALERGS